MSAGVRPLRLLAAAAVAGAATMALRAALRSQRHARRATALASSPRASASAARVPPPAASPPVPVPNPVRVALCQLGVTRDKGANIAAAVTAVRDAAAAGARLVVLPEMWNCPYGARA